MQIIDSHCHLDDERFDHDRDEVISRSKAAGIKDFIVPSVDRQGWIKLQQLFSRYDCISPAFGLHPWFCDRHRASDLEQLPACLDHAVAIGECGLDGSHLCHFDLKQQLPWFRAQLALAVEFDLPLILHAHKAVDLVLKELRKMPALRGVVHAFSGSQQQADQLIEQGFYLGVGGAVTFERASRLHAIVKNIPAEHLLLETDAPDQSPVFYRGARNEPAFLVEILAWVATLRGEDIDDLAAISCQNSRELFRL